MHVKAAPGVRVPKEEQPREYIAGGAPVEVPGSAYYLRRISDGDLVEVAAESIKPPKGAK